MTGGTFDFSDLDGYSAHGFPHAAFTRLRAEDPVHQGVTPGGEEFWLISRHEDVVRVSRDWRAFSSDNVNGGIVGLTRAERQRRIDNLVENTFVTMDPPTHTKNRAVVINAMLPSAIADVSARVRSVAIELIEAALEKDVCDFVVDISAWIPLEALAQLANVPIDDRQQVFSWVNAMLAPDDREYAASFADALEARRSMQKYCEALYVARGAEPGTDILSMMIGGEVDGELVSPKRAAAFFELLLAAGSETTRTSMSHAALAMAQFPDQYQQFRADPDRLRATAVDEILRWATPINYFRRGATVDYELRGKQIKAGDSVMIVYASANRDEEIFRDPFAFDITRKPNPHVAFGGTGPHNCLGMNLARTELRILLEELAKRVARIELMGDPMFLRSSVIHGIKHLPVKLHRL